MLKSSEKKHGENTRISPPIPDLAETGFRLFEAQYPPKLGKQEIEEVFSRLDTFETRPKLNEPISPPIQ